MHSFNNRMIVATILAVSSGLVSSAEADFLRPNWATWDNFNTGLGYNGAHTYGSATLTSESVDATTTTSKFIGKYQGEYSTGLDYLLDGGLNLYTVSKLYLWNVSSDDGFYDWGVRELNVYYTADSTLSDSTNWTQIGTTFDVAQAGPTTNRTAQTLDFGGDVEARWIRLEAVSSYHATYVGWDAVRFDASASTPAVPGVGGLAAMIGIGAVGRRRRR